MLTTTTDAPAGTAASTPTPRTVGWPALLALAVLAGALVGALTSFGQTLLGGTSFQGLANAVSPWLVASFLVGALARRPDAAAVAGLLGGPLFGVAGRLWRRGPSVGARWAGVGGALLAGCWLAEALVTYLVVLHRPDEALVFAAVGGLLVVLLGRGSERKALLTRLPLAAALGAAGFAVLHVALG